MAFALPKLPFGKANREGDDVPFGERFRAWWDGYDLDAARRPDSHGDEAGRSRDRARPTRRRAQNETDAATPDGAESGEDESFHGEWDEDRQAVAQKLWTPGFIVPGGASYVEELVSGCSLTAAETMLEIGVGMGGGTRAIIGKFGNYVTGYESDEALAEEARKQAIAYDIDSKLEVIRQPFAEIRLKKKYFRAALVRDVLFTVEDKEAVLAQICDSLKAGQSYLIITDLLFDKNKVTPGLRAWIDSEIQPVYPWTAGHLKSCIESHGVLARIVEDESDRYRSMVVSAWAHYLKDVNGKDLSPEFGRTLAHEAAFWARRVSAMESGALKYYRIEGVKTS